ncbi:hypothetical protein TURU_143302 [Turdus rufiventris]|nr:hypothetical protein TURU_143302 [Turdus rufiventris]
MPGLFGKESQHNKAPAKASCIHYERKRSPQPEEETVLGQMTAQIVELLQSELNKPCSCSISSFNRTKDLIQEGKNELQQASL